MATIEQIKALRDKTGVSVMQCKKALEESGGDIEKALVILRKSVSGVAAKKASRELGAGAVEAYVHATGTAGAMVLLLSETDFVAKNREFRALAYDIAMHITAMNPEFLRREDVSEKAIGAAREVFAKESAGKPEEVKEKIISGKMDAYFKEKVLLEQDFIKDQGRTIGDLIGEAAQKFGERVELSKFTRFSV